MELLTRTLELFVDLALLSSRLETIVLLVLKQLVFKLLVALVDFSEFVFSLCCFAGSLLSGVLALQQSHLRVLVGLHYLLVVALQIGRVVGR